MAESFKIGQTVKFKAGRATTYTEAKVTELVGASGFMVTKDAVGVERKVRPGSCTLAAD